MAYDLFLKVLKKDWSRGPSGGASRHPGMCNINNRQACQATTTKGEESSLGAFRGNAYTASVSIAPGKTGEVILKPTIQIDGPTLNVSTDDGYDKFELVGIVRGGKVVLPSTTTADLRKGVVLPGPVSASKPVKLIFRYSGTRPGVVFATLQTLVVSGGDPGVEELVQRAKKGDVAAQVALHKIRLERAAEGRDLSLGRFVGDEERAAGEAGSAERRAGRRIRKG
jgi:hypothetical protein